MSAHNAPQELLLGEVLVPDPGSNGTIACPQVTPAMCNIVTAGVESRTLASPTVQGQILTLFMKTDGGDCTITVVGYTVSSAFTTITMNDLGDIIVLMGVLISGVMTWRLVSNSGCGIT